MLSKIFRFPDAVESISSIDTDDKEGASSSSEEDKVGKQPAEETLASVVNDAAKGSESQPDAKPADGLVQDLNKTEGEKEKESGQKEELPAKEDPQVPKAPEDEKLPFHEHPRWKQVLGERNEYEQKLKQLEPLADEQRNVARYCQTNGVTPEEFQQAVEIAALLKNDPKAALERLKPVVAGLQSLNGESLPKDLADEMAQVQQELTDGTISEGAAQRYEARIRENAKLRAQTSLSSEQGKQGAQRQREAAIAQGMQAVNEWQKLKQSGDVDYKPKAKADEPHGLFELVDREFQFLVNNAAQSGQNVFDPKTVVALAEQAYVNIKASTQRFNPPPKARKGLPTTNSSTTKAKEPETLREAVEMAAAKHGF